MNEFYLDLMSPDVLHCLSIRDVFEVCMRFTKIIVNSIETTLFMGKPTEWSQFNHYYTRIKWNMSVLERALSAVGDANNSIELKDITLKYRNEKGEMSEIKAEVNLERFDTLGPAALSKMLMILSERTMKFLRGRQLAIPRIRTMPNVTLTEKCADLFTLAALTMNNNISRECEKLFPINKDTAFTFFELRLVICNRQSTSNLK